MLLSKNILAIFPVSYLFRRNIQYSRYFQRGLWLKNTAVAVTTRRDGTNRC